MIIHDVDQMSEDWFILRAGIPSASNFSKIVTTKGELSDSAKKYMYQLAGEKILGFKEMGYINAAMQHGIDTEPEARDIYSFITGNEVMEVGFCMADSEEYGCSPDGLVGKDGGLEIKCPQIATHVEYLTQGKLPTTYFQQVQGSMFVTSRKWWDFMSYYPGLKPFIVRVEADKQFHANLKSALDQFCSELKSTIELIKE